MSNLCGLDGCGRPAPDGTICWQHTWELERDLADIPALLVELDLTIARQTQTGPLIEKVNGKGETGVYFNQRAATAQRDLTGTLTAWAKDYGMPWAKYATTAAAHLLTNLPDNRTRGDLPNLCDEVLDACYRARQAVDIPAYRKVPVGPCPEHDEHGAYCTGNVTGFIPTDNKPGHMACDVGESHRWSSIQFYRAGRRIHDRADQIRRGA